MRAPNQLLRARARDSERRIRACALRAKVRASSAPVGLVVVYHLLDAATGNQQYQLVAPHGEELFAAHLGILRRHYTCVRASELPAAAAGRRRGTRPPVAITFDDDSPSHVERALPALATAGVPATFFLTGAHAADPTAYWWQDLEALWAREDAAWRAELARRVGVVRDQPDLRPVATAVELMPARAREALALELRKRAGVPPPVLNAEDIRRLVAAGHEVGFHTRRHHRLTTLRPAELELAMTEGRDALAALAGAPLETIAYPHGRVDPAVAEAARVHGFTAGWTTVARRHVAGGELLRAGRYWPSYGRPALFEVEVAQLVAGRWGYDVL